ncbi:hypothetical protein SRHO_G00074530 [Serrasalmus rhombeus]
MRSPAIKTVAPPGPFRHLQVDYITLPKCEGKQDVLVIVDKFSRWIECYPTSKGTAAHTAKMLVQDFIPRWGLPEQIESDQGTHFTGQVVQAVCKLLKVNWKLHCPYRPQASGQVERVNRVIKERLTKLHSQGVKWTAALPAVLCSIRATSNKTVGLSPYEVVTGRPMLVPGVIDLRKADVHLLSDALLNYCQTLAVQAAQSQVNSAWSKPAEGGHTIIPGQWVMVRKHDRQSLEPRWDGPYQNHTAETVSPSTQNTAWTSRCIVDSSRNVHLKKICAADWRRGRDLEDDLPSNRRCQVRQDNMNT